MPDITSLEQFNNYFANYNNKEQYIAENKQSDKVTADNIKSILDLCFNTHIDNSATADKIKTALEHLIAREEAALDNTSMFSIYKKANHIQTIGEAKAYKLGIDVIIPALKALEDLVATRVDITPEALQTERNQAADEIAALQTRAETAERERDARADITPALLASKEEALRTATQQAATARAAVASVTTERDIAIRERDAEIVKTNKILSDPGISQFISSHPAIYTVEHRKKLGLG